MQPEQKNDSATVIDTSEVSMEHSGSTENIMAQDNSSSKKKKNGKTGIILGFILLFLLAVGGVGFGIWAMMDGNAREKELSKQIDELKQYSDNNNSKSETADGPIVEEKLYIDNGLAQNIIKPYLGTFMTLNNVFDYDYNEDAKAYIAYMNVGKAYADVVSYDVLNSSYKDLFGNDNDLERRDYSGGCEGSLKYSDNKFLVEGGACGGTMMAMFSVVKNAYYNEDQLIIDVYHDTVGIKAACEEDGGDASYCVDADKSLVVIESIEDYNMRELIELNKDKVPVYRMTFVPDNGHYVLDLIEKV